MFDGVSFKDLASEVTPFVAFGTAFLGFMKARKEAAQQVLAKATVESINLQHVRQRPWNMGLVRWLGVAFGAALGVWGVFNFSDASGMFLAGEGALCILVFGTMRTRPPSRVRKTAKVVVRMSAGDAARRSLAAAESLARVARFDAAGGIVIASTGMNWRSLGEIITIGIKALDDATSEIALESDSIEPSAWIDLGANARNIERLTTAIAGTP
ncbi:MAG: hypothetical protein ACRENE_21125 [Polyangiaceae bacterium]